MFGSRGFRGGRREECVFQRSLLAIAILLAPDPAVFATLLLVFGAFFALLPVVSALRPVPQTDPFYV